VTNSVKSFGNYMLNRASMAELKRYYTPLETAFASDECMCLLYCKMMRVPAPSKQLGSALNAPQLRGKAQTVLTHVSVQSEPIGS